MADMGSYVADPPDDDELSRFIVGENGEQSIYCWRGAGTGKTARMALAAAKIQKSDIIDEMAQPGLDTYSRSTATQDPFDHLLHQVPGSDGLACGRERIQLYVQLCSYLATQLSGKSEKQRLIVACATVIGLPYIATPSLASAAGFATIAHISVGAAIELLRDEDLNEE